MKLPAWSTSLHRYWRHSWFVLAVQGIAFWPVWSWYVQRLNDRSDEPWGIAALGMALLLVCRTGTARQLSTPQLLITSSLTALYLCSYSVAPPLARALFAMLSVSCTLSACSNRNGLHCGLTGLLILSLPVIASLQFYAGYPIRLFTAYIAGKLISLTGHSVIADGTMLLWFGERIAVDAPCAGIRMLWTGLFLSFTLAVVFNFNARETWISYSCASVLLFSGNVLRNCLLFFLEAGIIQLPDGAHSGIGLTVFLLVAIGVILLNQKINTRSMQSNVARTRWATV